SRRQGQQAPAVVPLKPGYVSGVSLEPGLVSLVRRLREGDRCAAEEEGKSSQAPAGPTSRSPRAVSIRVTKAGSCDLRGRSFEKNATITAAERTCRRCTAAAGSRGAT